MKVAWTRSLRIGGDTSPARGHTLVGRRWRQIKPVRGAPSKAEIPVSNRDQRADSSRHIATADRPNLLKAGAVLQSRYKIHNVLGVGGMSTVYRARDLRFAGVERWCAVKEMFNLGDDPKLRQLRLTNFQREAALLAT